MMAQGGLTLELPRLISLPIPAINLPASFASQSNVDDINSVL
jgi:hypothetical protein